VGVCRIARAVSPTLPGRSKRAQGAQPRDVRGFLALFIPDCCDLASRSPEAGTLTEASTDGWSGTRWPRLVGQWSQLRLISSSDSKRVSVYRPGTARRKTRSGESIRARTGPKVSSGSKELSGSVRLASRQNLFQMGLYMSNDNLALPTKIADLLRLHRCGPAAKAGGSMAFMTLNAGWLLYYVHRSSRRCDRLSRHICLSADGTLILRVPDLIF